MFLVERANNLLRVEHFVTRDFLNIASSDFALFIHVERKFLWLVTVAGLEFYFLQVEHDIGDVLDDSRQRGELMLHSGDFYRDNGGAFERGKQYASERISNGVTVSGLKGLGGKLGVSVSGCALFFRESFRHFKTTVTDWHIFILDCRLSIYDLKKQSPRVGKASLKSKI